MTTRKASYIRIQPLIAGLAFSAALGSSVCSPAAQALSAKIEKCDAAAQKAFADGDYRRAQMQFERLRAELDKSEDKVSEKNQAEYKACQVKTLKGLGECAMAMKNFAQACDYLTEAKAALNDSTTSSAAGASTDKSLEGAINDALALLSNNYREIDLSSFGAEVSEAFREVNAERVAVAKTENGHHVEITLADKVIKPISQKHISEIAFDKVIAFDVSEPAEGEVRIEHITGLHVHAQLWINVIASRVRKEQNEQAVAEVTGEKMGFSQSVRSRLPDQIYQPIIAIVGKVRDAFGVSAPPTPNYTNGVNDGSQVGEIIPASNSSSEPPGETEN